MTARCRANDGCSVAGKPGSQAGEGRTLDVACATSLLAYLLLYRNAPWSRQRLAFVLWPDSAVTASSDATAPLLHSSDALAIPLRGGRRPRARASSGIRRLAEPEASDRRGRVVEMDEQREHYAPRAPPLTMQMHAGSRPTPRPKVARRLQSSLRRLRAAFRALLLRPDGPLGGGGKKPAMRGQRARAAREPGAMSEPTAQARLPRIARL